MNKEEKNKNNEDDEKEEVSWYETQQNKTANIIKKYNIGTLQMFISPEILSMTSKERKKIEKIYYKREYTITPSELQKSQKDYEKELSLQKEQKENELKQPVNNMVAVAPAVAPPATPMLPPAPALPAPPPANLQKKKEPMLGGAFYDYGFNDSADGLYDNNRGRVDANRGIGTGTGTGTTLSSKDSNILTRVLPDSEPFIASLVKFNNSGFPNNTTIKGRVDTFFNINLFKAFLKKLGEPIKLYSNENQLVSVDDVAALNRDKEQIKGDGKSNSKNKVYETDQQTQGNFITNWYPAQEQKTLIGSVYAFIYTRPTEQENKQQAELGKKVSSASMLMIKEGDNYRLIGGPVDNKVKVNYPGYSSPVSMSTDKYNTETSERTVESQINDYYKRVTGQGYLPQSVSNTARRFIYEPDSSFSKNVDATSGIKDLKSVIYSRQVTSAQIESIIESSRASSTDIVKVPISTLFNILNGKIQTLQIKIDLSPEIRTVIKFMFRILEKQNLLSTISGQQKKKAGEIYENRIEKLREKLSESSLNDLDSIIRHNIRFILDIIFSNKMAFKYKGIEYIIDYLEWNNTFKQLNKVLENYKVAYYIELELFLEKLEKGKLAIDRDGTLLSSCAVRGSQLNNFWKRNFVERDWSKVGKQLTNSIKVTSAPSITDILPGFIKKALEIGSSHLMSPLNAGVNQISLVQYCFLGQEQLVEQFKRIDNSFAGVSWKNENSWSRRKEILFAAMDSCNSDIYCFQNVQCSLEAYRKIISSLSDQKKETLEDVTTNKVQPERIQIYRNVLNQLLEDVNDPLNLVAQIYERYRSQYTFVYFFEQDYSGVAMITGQNKTAVGHLTMFKSDKFELKDEFDIRIAPFMRKNKTKLESIKSLEPIYNNKSFGTITYCKFKGGKYTKTSQLPGQTVSLSKQQSATLPSSPSSPTSPVLKTQTNLPGMPGYVGSIKINEDDDIPIENAKKESVEAIKDYEEESSVAPSAIPSGSPSTSPSTSRPVSPQRGGDDGEWYNRDTSEQTGFLSGLFGNKDMSKQPKVKAEAEPCKKYMNPNYTPGGQIFGIINIKLEVAETLRQIEDKQVTPGTPGTQATSGTPATTNKKITKQMLEVLLIASFISKFRSRYYLSSSTDVNPYFMAGDFNFDIPNNEVISKGTIKDIYLKAPALALMLTRSNNVFKAENYPSLKDYSKEISDFIYETCKILTYLYGGQGKNGRLRLIGYTNSQTLSNMFGNKYSLTDPNKVNKGELIFTTGKLLLCPKEEMNKIVNSDSPEGLPIFPNKSNPSNSEAIGGVFELDTVFVQSIIQNEEKNITEEQENQQRSIQDEAKRSIIQQLNTSPTPASSSVSIPSRPSSPSIPSRPSSPSSPSLRPTVSGKATSGEEEEEGEKEIPDWALSTSGIVGSKSVKLVPDAISLSSEDITKLHNFDYTASKADTVKGSPYKNSVFICETGKPDYEYLTDLEIAKWNDNKNKLYSDHSPIMYKINNSGSSQCGPQMAVSGAGVGAGASAIAGGDSGDSGDSSDSDGYESEEMEGGAFPTEINLITWNIAGYGGKDEVTGNTFYFHKFNGKMEEGIEHYKSRLSNNARAIAAMINSGYDYVLIQEGPYSRIELNLNKGQPKPFNYKNHFTDAINSVGNLVIIPSVISTNDKYYSEFYLVINKKTVKKEDIKSLGLLIVGLKNYFSNDEAATIFTDIMNMLIQKKIKNYDDSTIKKDCSRLWFFVNTKNKQILVSTHLQLNEKNTPKMYERQQQVYILLNTVVSYFRQNASYRDFDIVFSGDFNINMLQPFPTDIRPTFLKCNSVAGQQTFIYTSKNNAPSSFGGDNEGKYNPTNIDFALFYPKPNPKISSTPKMVGFVATSPPGSSKTSPPPPPPPVSDQRITKVDNITYKIESEIFKALPVVPTAPNILYKNVSVVGTYYDIRYATANIMPAGSATLLYIGDKPLNNITYDHPNAKTGTSSGITVDYMIQASPGKSGSGELITRDTLSNSVMNSLIIAALNKVEFIIFPFIGGELFLKELQRVELAAGRTHNTDRHAEILIKGVVNFYNFIGPNKLTNTIKQIFFCPWGETETKALTDAKTEAIKQQHTYLDVAVQISKGKTNIIEETVNLRNSRTPIPINAIVNAANVELTFGSGVSSMCYAAIGNNDSKQQDLYKTKTMFIDAFKTYIKQKNAAAAATAAATTPSSKLTTSSLKSSLSDDWKEYRTELLAEPDKVPEADRNIFIDIETFDMFTESIIDKTDTFNKIMKALIICNKDGKTNPKYEDIQKFLLKIYASGIYYILNDLCYFKIVKIDEKYCFIEDLFSNGTSNTNLLKDIILLTTEQFNNEYLLNQNEDNIKKISDKREKYLGTIDEGGYTDYDGKKITVEIVDDILGFLYDSERYSLYLYLIDETQPVEGKKILVKLYSTIVKQKNDKVTEIVDNLNTELAATIQKSNGKTGQAVPKGPERPKGESNLLKAVKYIKQRTNGDGNCFYNSVGMLSSEYLRDKSKFEAYDKETIEKQYKTQYVEQIRVRRALTAFMRNIYKVIIKSVDMNSSQYKKSSIIKYIVKNGNTDRNFKYVSIERTPVGSKYYGTDSEIYFASLYYRQPIVTVTGMSDVSMFNVFYWDSYEINGMNFVDYIRQTDANRIDVNAVLKFLYDSNQQLSCDVDEISVFLMYYPSSYFLVGGRGHWSYAINKDLIGRSDSGTSVGGDGGGGGGGDSKIATHNLRVTKKIKKNDNKYYNKSSSSKTTRKHKRTRKGNNNKKRNKKTIKYNR
jgi:hypothetical protein